jgi:hypothetical protein
MSKRIYFATGTAWDVPDDTDLRALVDGIKWAMEERKVLEYQVQWGPENAQTLLINGAQMAFVAVGGAGDRSR